MYLCYYHYDCFGIFLTIFPYLEYFLSFHITRLMALFYCLCDVLKLQYFCSFQGTIYEKAYGIKCTYMSSGICIHYVRNARNREMGRCRRWLHSGFWQGLIFIYIEIWLHNINKDDLCNLVQQYKFDKHKSLLHNLSRLLAFIT